MKHADVIAALAAMPTALEQRLLGLTDAQLRFKPSAETFSALESVCHLRDIEVEGYGRRLGLMLREENPTLPDLDGSALARERLYNEQSLKPALDAFLSMRQRCLDIITDLSSEDLARRGQFENVGEVSLADLLMLWAKHDQEHIRELDELLPLLQQPQIGHKSKPSLSLR